MATVCSPSKAMRAEAAAAVASPVGAQPPQYAETETYSRSILGPVMFELSELRVEGTADLPVPPTYVAPGQSPYIIAADEEFVSSVKIVFNRTPLSSLLMCLGTQISMNFHFEGQGRKATEIDLLAEITTQKDVYEYEVKLSEVPKKAGLTPGLYVVSATAEIGPAEHECSQFILGYGYIAGTLLQVYKEV
ncbi:hypothetical protein [Leptolyngbya sp. O-77]|uniref:hypothetical protein n=1 Tax=Leptolyngbya sp. O-77 TaxID=1080068 RepID=UPI00074D3901|nr:hypothetical protein [Leptolyngbya sp. O-77]BAU41871.1 hypothetical protein O77CONTIG1_01689 [Leptolyngbya sp. O-77]